MGPLRYSINVTLDGCCDHEAIGSTADAELHRHAAANIERADAMLVGRVTYELMRSAWGPPLPSPADPEGDDPFGAAIGAIPKYVVSSTLAPPDWSSQLVTGDLGEAVLRLKRESERGVLLGGVRLPLALAELGLIDEYELIVHPRLAGGGRTPFAGLSKPLDLRLVGRHEFGSGAVALQYEPAR